MIDERTVWDDIWPVVERLISATLAEDPQAIQQQLLPGEQAAEALDLFGFVVFDILLKTVLGRERLGLTRAIEANEGQSVFIEYAWPDPESGSRSYTAVDVVSVRLSRQADDWLVAEINPAAIDLPLNGPRARSVLAGAQALSQDGAGQAPWVLPFTLYAGLLQLPIETAAMADAVEMLLLPGMQQRGFGLLSLIHGRRLWRDYRALAAPQLDEAGTWAAAVEFIIGEQTRRLETQAAVGKPYRASLGALSRRIKEIRSALQIEELDERYSDLRTTEIVYKESSQ